MAIRFRCTHCDQLLSIASRKSGQQVPCPACNQKVTVPDEQQLSAPEEVVSASSSSPAEINRPAEEQNESRDTESQDHQTPFDNDAVDVVETGSTETGSTSTETGTDDDDEEFALRRANTDFGEMDLTPMVDVTFLLLIFFMVTASFNLQKSIEVPSPEPDQEGATQSIETPEDLQENSIIVQIDERNVISIDYEPVADPANLADLLADRRRSEDKHELIIDADDRAKHGTVVLVTDAAVEADFQRIRLAVHGGG